MCVIFCVGPPMMSLVFLVFKVIHRPDGMGTSMWWKYFHSIFCSRDIHINYIERQKTFEGISGLKMLIVCLHTFIYTQFYKYTQNIKIYTHFNFVISKHTNLKKYQSIQVLVPLWSEQILTNQIPYFMWENRVEIIVMAPLTPDSSYLFIG